MSAVKLSLHQSPAKVASAYSFMAQKNPTLDTRRVCPRDVRTMSLTPKRGMRIPLCLPDSVLWKMKGSQKTGTSSKLSVTFRATNQLPPMALNSRAAKW